MSQKQQAENQLGSAGEGVQLLKLDFLLWCEGELEDSLKAGLQLYRYPATLRSAPTYLLIFHVKF